MQGPPLQYHLIKMPVRSSSFSMPTRNINEVARCWHARVTPDSKQATMRGWQGAKVRTIGDGKVGKSGAEKQCDIAYVHGMGELQNPQRRCVDINATPSCSHTCARRSAAGQGAAAEPG